MEINGNKEQWLIRSKADDDFKIIAKVISEEDKKAENGSPFSVLHISNAEGDYQVSSWALICEKGVKCKTVVGEHVKIYCKPGNTTKFFIRNVEEDLK